ncbi:hypothetical protein KAS08_00925 [Candidatus Pacearchaeota archaeon]|nr:hypothetical protein [Candidatus Pacearchaeota archaeon]
MASKEELYVSIDRGVYRGGKSNLLMCQASTLASLKRLYNLKVLARQKNDLKKILLRLMKSVNSEINAIQKRMPTSSIPKTIQVTTPIIEIQVEKPKPKQSVSRRSGLDIELRLIQEKLAQLNS